MLRKFILLFSSFWLSAAALAANSSFYDELYFSIGSHTEFYNEVQQDTSGGMRKFDFAPTIGAGMGFDLNEQFSLIPEINWMLPQFIEDSQIMTNLWMFRGDVAYDPLEWLRLRLGTSLMWSNQHGRGGSTKMNNGNDQTTFYYPDENRSSLNNTLDLGIETIFDQFAIRLQTYTYSIFKKEQRQYSYTLFLTYYWDK
jgi:hypothetical protein